MNSCGELRDCGQFGIEDERRALSVMLKLDTPGDFWYAPAQTVSQSESGFELNYQSSIVVPSWRVELHPGEPAARGIVLSAQPGSG